eukprot:1157437-Pelagomonas_calceolata.AAC.6
METFWVCAPVKTVQSQEIGKPQLKPSFHISAWVTHPVHSNNTYHPQPVAKATCDPPGRPPGKLSKPRGT